MEDVKRQVKEAVQSRHVSLSPSKMLISSLDCFYIIKADKLITYLSVYWTLYNIFDKSKNVI